MASFVLVPGAMHGKWMWERLTPLLERAGHTVTALDLPGMGADTSIAVEDITLAHWTNFVAEMVRAARAPVILVGHSRGGLVIGEVAERVAEQLQGLIYVTALLVPPGKTVHDLAGAQTNARAGASFGNSSAIVLSPEVAMAMFYNRCTPEDAAWAASQLCPEPAQPLATPSSVTWERWGRVPRAFIECADDRVIPLERQHMMQTVAPCDPVIRLDTDHSPFLSAPDDLAAAMCRIAQTLAARN